MTSVAASVTASTTPPPGTITVPLYTPEASLLAQALGDSSVSQPLAGRLLDACSTAQAGGNTTLQFTLTPSEQGLVMGALRQCTCQFSSGVRLRVQNAMVGNLQSMGAPGAL